MTNPSWTVLGGSLAMNFINTVQRHNDQTVDLLPSPQALDRWLEFMHYHNELHGLQYARLLQPGLVSIDELRRFREWSRQFLARQISVEPFQEGLAILIKKAPLLFEMVEQNSQREMIALPACGGSAGLLSLLAYDWMTVLSTDQISRVSACANPRCLAYFINHSGRRKWCSMNACGNRQKSARHYARRTSNPLPPI